MRKYPYFDTHCDTLTKIYRGGSNIKDPDCMVNLKNMRNYRSPVQVFAIFNEGDLSFGNITDSFECLKAECRNNSRFISVAKNSRDVRHNIRHGKASAILSIEGLGNEINFDISNIEKYKKIGVLFAGLCWNGDNILCGGAGRNLKGMSELGLRAIDEMERVGIIADVSHMSEASFWDLAEHCTRPFAATHSGSRHVYNHPRNLTDAQFRQLIKAGGVCGINFYPPFLNDGKCNVDDIVRHIDHFMSLGGENNIGIGADFDGIDVTPTDVKCSADVYKVFDRLLSINYKESTVNKIAFYNFYNLINNFEI